MKRKSTLTNPAGIRKKKGLSEDHLWKVHHRELIRRYGKKRADMANFGWYSEKNNITSKVYGKPTRLLSTFILNGKIVHEEGPY